MCWHAQQPCPAHCSLQVLRDTLPGLLQQVQPDLVCYNAGRRRGLFVVLPAATCCTRPAAAFPAPLAPGALCQHATCCPAGVDVHAEDSLGQLRLTTQGIYERDSFVLAACAQHGAPVAAAIGGGYEPRHDHIVDRHVCLHRAASEQAAELWAGLQRRRAAIKAARS